ncbi:hypothetical protein ACFRAQ_34590 [Nocardia sp. NPDC056611]|uniref:hypothetical protein n=1 Tax=Nocardia sp. NPDC056611 TaxID=3345877 RepID=UPI00366B46A7
MITAYFIIGLILAASLAGSVFFNWLAAELTIGQAIFGVVVALVLIPLWLPCLAVGSYVLYKESRK